VAAGRGGREGGGARRTGWVAAPLALAGATRAGAEGVSTFGFISRVYCYDESINHMKDGPGLD
jgi:hypothetical protein